MQEEHRRLYTRVALWSFVGAVALVAIIVTGLAFASLQEERGEGEARQLAQRNVIASGRSSSPLGTSAGEKEDLLATQGESGRAEGAQIGLNFIRVFTDDTGRRPQRGRATPIQTSGEGITSPEWIFSDFSELGVQVYRQLTEADVSWANIEQVNDAWSFDAPDAVLPSLEYEPVVTLFSMQYASGTPPWARSSAEFEPRLGSEAQEYLDAVLERYGDVVRYWEIGNEMDHWRAADPVASTGRPLPPGASSLPLYAPSSGFSPEDQGVFLAEVAQYIRERDEDAIIVLPGMAGLDTYVLDTWLRGVLAGGGADFFDIVNYHYYGSSEAYTQSRANLSAALQDLGIADKPVWLTETGVTSDPSLTQRTNYPNSSIEQASEVVKRLALAYAAGDDLVLWHTHVSSSDEGSSSDWRAYGLRTSTGEAKPAWYTFKLFAQELIPFVSVEILENGTSGVHAYAFLFDDGSRAIVAWGEGTYTVPAGITQVTPMVSEGGDFVSTQTSATISLTDSPVLLQ